MRAETKACAAALAFFFLAASAAADGGLPRVLQASGAEVLRGSRWTPLAKGERLPNGSELRTSETGSLLVGFDDALESVGQLGPGSRLALRGGASGPVFLRKGRLFLLREPRRAAEVFLVATPDARIYVESGGLAAEAAAGATSVRVYGDRVRVASGAKSALKNVGEGFELRAGGGAGALRRMTYADYAEWLQWVKRWYEAKDDLDADILEKEYDL